MAADVSSCSSMVNNGNSEILTTKDLLGGLSQVVGNKDLDPDLQVHKAWEMPLDDLKSGMVYRQLCSSPNSNSSFNNKNHKQKTTQNSEISNSNSPPFKFLEESCLELKLVSSSQYCQSVCTLDKVRSALQRAEKETSCTPTNKKRSSPPSILTLSSVVREEQDGDEKKSVSSSSSSTSSSTGMFAAACPGCLLYVITLKTNPKCPRCNSTVPFPLAVKKPRIDLNASL